jgi:hypothetical protein
MSPEAADLARRLVASERWEWRRGMVDTFGDTCLTDGPTCWTDDNVHIHAVGDDMREADAADRWRHALPDLDDPATAGAIFALLVESDPAAGWALSCGPDVGWRATCTGYDLGGDTMGHAAGRALEAVWMPPCSSCEGLGRFGPHGKPAATGREDCLDCAGTGREQPLPPCAGRGGGRCRRWR